MHPYSMTAPRRQWLFAFPGAQDAASTSRVAGQEAREGLLEIRLAVQTLPDLGNHITQKALASGFLNFTRKKTLGRV